MICKRKILHLCYYLRTIMICPIGSHQESWNKTLSPVRVISSVTFCHHIHRHLATSISSIINSEKSKSMDIKHAKIKKDACRFQVILVIPVYCMKKPLQSANFFYLFFNGLAVLFYVGINL